jgi:hypothetical protein
MLLVTADPGATRSSLMGANDRYFLARSLLAERAAEAGRSRLVRMTVDEAEDDTRGVTIEGRTPSPMATIGRIVGRVRMAFGPDRVARRAAGA